MKIKRLLSLLICVWLCVFSVIGASAASVTYSAGDTGIKINIPDSMSVFTRGISPDDSKISEILGMTYENLMSKYQLENIYLEAMDPDTYENIVVTSVPTSDKNYFDMTDDELIAAVSKERDLYVSTGSVDFAELYQSPNGVNYVKIAKNADSAKLIYITVYNGNKVTINYTNFSSEITSGQESGFKAVIDSAVFPEKKIDEDEKIPEDDDDDAQEVTQENEKEDESQISTDSGLGSDAVSDSDADLENQGILSKLGIKNVLIIVLGAIVIVLILVVIFGRKSGSGKRRR